MPLSLRSVRDIGGRTYPVGGIAGSNTARAYLENNDMTEDIFNALHIRMP